MNNVLLLIRSVVIGLTIALLSSALPISALAQQPPGVPGRTASAEATAEPQGFISEPDAIKRAVIFADRNVGGREAIDGLYADFLNMMPGAGWISGGPGYRRWYAKDSALLDTSAAISWRGYKTAQARFELPRLARSRLAVGSQVRWQDFTQVRFFGEGPGSHESDSSKYRLRSQNLVAYATVRPVKWVDIGAQVGWLSPSILPPTGLFRRDRPDTRDVFRRDIVFALPDQPTFVHSEVSITADTRDFDAHPTRGGVLRAAATHYSDRDGGVFSFTRYEAGAIRFVPLAGARVVLALDGWLYGSATREGQVVPFYLQPSLGGENTLRGYDDYRFHDRDLLVINVETRIAMMTHVDAAFFVDAGNVASRVGDLNLEKRSYGAGLRLHSRRQTYARLDVARSSEGWGFIFRITDPFNLSRLSRRTAAVPFVP